MKSTQLLIDNIPIDITSDNVSSVDIQMNYEDIRVSIKFYKSVQLSNEESVPMSDENVPKCSKECVQTPKKKNKRKQNKKKSAKDLKRYQYDQMTLNEKINSELYTSRDYDFALVCNLFEEQRWNPFKYTDDDIYEYITDTHQIYDDEAYDLYNNATSNPYGYIKFWERFVDYKNNY